MLGSDRDMEFGFSGGKVIGTIFGNIYEITLEMDVGTYLVSLYGSFLSFNNGKIEGLFI